MKVFNTKSSLYYVYLLILCRVWPKHISFDTFCAVSVSFLYLYAQAWLNDILFCYKNRTLKPKTDRNKPTNREKIWGFITSSRIVLKTTLIKSKLKPKHIELYLKTKQESKQSMSSPDVKLMLYKNQQICRSLCESSRLYSSKSINESFVESININFTIRYHILM